MTDDRQTVRQTWFDWFTNVVPPLTLAVSLLVYFGWIRRIAFATTLGLDPSLLQEATIPGFLMRSIAPLYLPMVVTTVFALCCLGLTHLTSRWLDDRRTAHRVLWTARLVPAAAVVGMAAVLCGQFIGPGVRAVVELSVPFLLTLNVVALRYAINLRRKLKHGKKARGAPVGALLSGLLGALFLFSGVDGFAKVVGRGLARQIIDESARTTHAVVLYSRSNLQLDPGDASGSVSGTGADRSFSYRYDGLRLAFADGGSYYLLPRNWQSQHGKIIILRQDDLRIEFLRP